jgi:Domain of unknown function (DUF5615)
LRLRDPSIDVLLASDAGLLQADDPAVLTWAAENDRIVLTHNRATMRDFAYERLLAGRGMPGLFVLNDRLPVRVAIDELQLVNACSEMADWTGRVVHLPI